MAVPLQHKSILGKELQVHRKYGNLLGRNTEFTRKAVFATIAATVKAANARTITVQLYDDKNKVIDYVEDVDITAVLDAGGVDYAVTGGTTGIAQGASGKVLAVVAKKFFKAKTTAAGLLVFTYTDTGTEAVFIEAKLPNGFKVLSIAM